MIGKIISHYKIIEEIGAGGMGIVYKAEDTKLKRTVALKFLPPELTRDEETKKRFIHEAQAASALQHTNICTIHDIDQTNDGQMFICMDYYEGETLKKKIEQGPLRIEEALDISIQIARGLTKAHEQHIIHRDIKPANILLTKEGVAKIVDFGLAKLAGRTMLTKEGTTLGTIAYMSPEQTRGEEVDHRTDIWSLGVILYEMITGQSPFKGEYEQAVMYSIVNEQPEPPTAVRTGVPMELERIINKSLSKNPDERYQHADELITDLKKLKKDLESEKTFTPKAPILDKEKLVQKPILIWRRPFPILILVIVVIILIFGLKWILKKDLVIPEEKSIAVLPFITITKAEEDQIFTDGIHDDILTQLAKIRDLKVIARTSVMQYKHTKKQIKEIGKELGVNSVLEGSVRRAGNRIRIVAQLIDAQTEEHLWAETYDRDYTDIFAIQSDVAQKIAIALKAALTPEEKSSIEKKPTENMEAYNYYLKGNHYWYNYSTKEGNEKAAWMYEKAVELDPGFVLAYAKLSVVNVTLSLPEYRDITGTRARKAKAALDKAIELNPDLPEVHFAQGYYYRHIIDDKKRALDEYKIVLEEQPNNSDVLSEMGILFLGQGKWNKGFEYLKKSYELDPHGINQAIWVGGLYSLERKWSEAERFVNLNISDYPEHSWGYLRKTEIYAYGYGDLKKARAVIEEGLQYVEKASWSVLTGIRWRIEIFSRDYQKALAVLDSDETSPFYMRKAQTLILMGKSDKAKAKYDSARIFYEKLIKDYPENEFIISRLRQTDAWLGRKTSEFIISRLGLSYAGLGRKAEAIRAGQKAVELNPIKSDAHSHGERLLLNLAHIYIMTKEYDKAIDQLEILLSIPSPLTRWRLKLDPRYDPLRDYPRFQKLLE